MQSNSLITDPKEKISAALGALFFFAPSFMEKKTEFVTFYMRQGFAVFLIQFIIIFINNIIGFIPGLGIILDLIFFGFIIIVLFLWYKAYQGQRFEIKFLSDIANALINKVDFLRTFFAPKK